METLTPVQRVAVVTIGLSLTVVAAIVVLPWASKQIEVRLPPTDTPLPPTVTKPPTSTALPGPTPSQSTPLTPSPTRILLAPMVYVRQTAGNNAPASLEIAFSYWGYTDTQEVIRAAVQPGALDTSAEPKELVVYAQSRQLAAYSGVNGDTELLREFLASQFPVLVTRWIMTEGGVGEKHYQVIRGYDRQAETFTLHDTVLGPDIELSDAELEDGWRVTNRQYLIVFPPQHDERIRALVNSDERDMWASALERAEREIAQDEENPYAWLNQASALAALGRCEEAVPAFDRAAEIGIPTLLLGYQFGIYECMVGLEEYDRLMALTQQAIDEGLAFERLYLYRAQV